MHIIKLLLGMTFTPFTYSLPIPGPDQLISLKESPAQVKKRYFLPYIGESYGTGGIFQGSNNLDADGSLFAAVPGRTSRCGLDVVQGLALTMTVCDDSESKPRTNPGTNPGSPSSPSVSPGVSSQQPNVPNFQIPNLYIAPTTPRNSVEEETPPEAGGGVPSTEAPPATENTYNGRGIWNGVRQKEEQFLRDFGGPEGVPVPGSAPVDVTPVPGTVPKNTPHFRDENGNPI